MLEYLHIEVTTSVTVEFYFQKWKTFKLYALRGSFSLRGANELFKNSIYEIII